MKFEDILKSFNSKKDQILKISEDEKQKKLQELSELSYDDDSNAQ